MKKENEPKKRLEWLWEFSKRIVVLCAAAYFIVIVFVMFIIGTTGKTGPLGTLLSKSADILKTCVFGYFVKAGAENLFKIKKEKKEKGKDDEEDDI